MTIAITGGTGFVGQAVIEVLRDRGYLVRALARRTPAPIEGVEWVSGDLADRAALAQLVDSAQAVIHIAGLTTSTDIKDFEAANVTGTRELIEAASAAKIPRFVFTSSLAAREPRLSAYGMSKAEAEKIVSGSALDWTIVRPPAVYGPRDTDMLELFKAAKRSIVPMPPPGRASMIYVYDLAQLLAALAAPLPAATRRTYEPDDGRADGWTHRELARAIGQAVGTRPWVPHLSREWLVRAARADSMLRGRKAKLTLDRVSYMIHPDWVADRAAGVPKDIWLPQLPTQDGLKRTADWYRQAGWL